MVDERKTFGQACEDIVARFLQQKGYKIIHRNFRNSLGEIDIIAKHKGVTVFVEVKARRTLTYGNPKEAITPTKKCKMSKVALAYLKQHGGTRTPARFDVVTVQPAADGPKIEVIVNAFELAYL
jgi:putative endonuclease